MPQHSFILFTAFAIVLLIISLSVYQHSCFEEETVEPIKKVALTFHDVHHAWSQWLGPDRSFNGAYLTNSLDQHDQFVITLLGNNNSRSSYKMADLNLSYAVINATKALVVKVIWLPY